MQQSITTQIDSIKYCKFYKQTRIQNIINQHDNHYAILKALLAYEVELLKLERDDYLKYMDGMPDYEDDFQEINNDLVIGV
jgi:hypothetical protein